MRKDINLIRHALEEHLSAINENSAEIQALFDYLHQIEVKVDKLTERLDQLQLTNQGEKPLPVSSLNHIEKNVFLILYTEELPLSFVEIAKKADLPKHVVAECVSSLVQKGIPLDRSYFDDCLFIKLEEHFKEVQAKENIINLSLTNFITDNS